MTPHAEDEKIHILTEFYGHFVPAKAPRVELDLGCGNGSFTGALAKRCPQSQILAADVMIGRLRKLVRRCEREEIANMSILRCEARMLIGKMLPDSCLDRIHLLCPDPWPKDRHRGHRLLASNFTALLHRVLKADGIFHFSSDDPNYCDAVGRVLAESGLFADAPESIADIADIRSDFENRWIEQGKTVTHRAWRKLPLPPHTIGH